MPDEQGDGCARIILFTVSMFPALAGVGMIREGGAGMIAGGVFLLGLSLAIDFVAIRRPKR